MRYFVFIIAAYALTSINVCSKKQSAWTEDEKDNIQHFLRALDHRGESTKIINSGKHNTPKDRAENITKIRKYSLNALKEAKLVRDDLLQRLHPNLRENFRDKF